MSNDDTQPLPAVPATRPGLHWWQQPPSFWPGLVAGFLAFSVGVSIMALAISAAIAEGRQGQDLSQSAAALLSTSLGGALGAVATYIGLSYAERRAGAALRPPDPPEPPEAP